MGLNSEMDQINTILSYSEDFQRGHFGYPSVKDMNSSLAFELSHRLDDIKIHDECTTMFGQSKCYCKCISIAPTTPPSLLGKCPRL